jgi:hypothetical protein
MKYRQQKRAAIDYLTSDQALHTALVKPATNSTRDAGAAFSGDAGGS